jgi:hypothetical protein
MLERFVESLTPVGRAVVLLGPMALVVAVASGWREFSVIGVGSVLAVLVALGFIGRPQAIGVSRTLVPSKVTVGESSTGVVTVRNTTRRRCGPRNAEDVLGDRLVQLSIPALKAGEQVDEHYVVPAPRRGVFDVGPVRLTQILLACSGWCRVRAQSSVCGCARECTYSEASVLGGQRILTVQPATRRPAVPLRFMLFVNTNSVTICAMFTGEPAPDVTS